MGNNFIQQQSIKFDEEKSTNKPLNLFQNASTENVSLMMVPGLMTMCVCINYDVFRNSTKNVK
jgi:hypothetical protein